MNNKHITSALIAAAALLTACDDSFFEVKDPNGEPLEEYYMSYPEKS